MSSSILDRCVALFDKAKSGRGRMQSQIAIPCDQNDPAKLGPVIELNKHYFTVRVNDQFLSEERHWWTHYDPMVFVYSQFQYGKEKEFATPFVVGPSLWQKAGITQPLRMVFSDTRVAGPHPYKGGRLALSVILYRVKRDDWASRVLGVVENTAGALDYTTAVSVYTKVVGAILDGVNTLLDLGGTVPIMSHRFEIEPKGNQGPSPCYYALIDAPAVKSEELQVRGGKLKNAAGEDFRDADYVLYSLTSDTTRSDERTLPFYPLWQRVESEAMHPTSQGWESAKANMLALYQTIMQSDDLTESQAEALVNDYQNTMKRRHKRAVDIGVLGKGEVPNDVRDGSLKILALE